MKIKDAYANPIDATATFKTLGRPIAEFSEWMESDISTLVPDWLRVGTRYHTPIFDECPYYVVGISIGTVGTVSVKQADPAAVAVTVINLNMFVKSFDSGERILICDTPEWLTVGMRYWPNDHKEYVYVVTNLDTGITPTVFVRRNDRPADSAAPIGLHSFVSSFEKNDRIRIAPLPEWVEKGARFFIDGIESRIMKVVDVLWESERLRLTDEQDIDDTFLVDFKSFNTPDHQCIHIRLPDWVRLGVRFANTKEPKKTYQLKCFVDRQIRAVSGELFPIAGFENGHYYKTSDVPDWVKRGSRYYITDIESPAFIIESVDLKKNIVFSFKENGWEDDLIPQPVSLDNFIGPEATCQLLKVPDWVKVGAHFLPNGDHCTQTVKWFIKDKAQTNVRSYCFSDFASTENMVMTSAPIFPPTPKWPAWVKLNVELRYISDNGELDDSTYTISGVLDDRIIAYCTSANIYTAGRVGHRVEISHDLIANRVVVKSPYPSWVQKGVKYIYNNTVGTGSQGPYEITRILYDNVIGNRVDIDGRIQELHTPPIRFTESDVCEFHPVPKVYLNQVTHELIVVSDRPYGIKNTVSDVEVKDQMMIPLVPKM